MGDRRPAPPSVEAYIAALPPLVGEKLEEIRSAIRRVAPEATEKISYGIPAFALEGSPFIFFAGFDSHVSVYPVHQVDPALSAELTPYLSGKATARFALDRPIPAELIGRIARQRLEAHMARARARGEKRKSRGKGEG